ncbi:MAG: cytochrome c [Pseudomonadota bacterium]
MISEARQRALRRELGEPEEMRNPVPWPIAMLALVLVSWGAWYYFQNTGYALMAGDKRTVLPAAPAADSLDGGRLYTNNCSSCHQGNGGGLAGVFPPLAGSSWVTGSDERLVQILLYGIQGPIEVNGVTYNGAMPAFGYLSDGELAAVLTFIRSSWGNSAPPIEEAAITDGRGRFADRTTPWGGGEELNEVFPPTGETAPTGSTANSGP